MGELSNLANAGLAGVAIFAIGAIVIIVNRVLKLIGNHMEHNTKSNTELAAAIREMIRTVEKSIR